MKEAHRKRILLIDDDVVFSKIVDKVARLGGINLTVVNSLKGWDWSTYKTYDAIVVDYDLGNITGIQLVRSLENENSACLVPTILVSSYRNPGRNWPASIRHFLHKSEGPQRILRVAISLPISASALG